MIPRKDIAAITLALAAGVSTASAQTWVWSDDFSPPLVGWTPVHGQITEVNEQFVLSASFGPFQTNSPTATHAAGVHSIPTSGPLPDNQTLELRADLGGANQADAWAGLHFFWLSQGQGYIFFKDQDEVGICKFYDSANSLAWFFYEHRPLPNENVTLVLALTRRGSNVEITTRVLDKDNANALVFERTVTDTPQADPVLPGGTVRGSRSEPDVPGTPWPLVTAATHVTLSLQWMNPDSAPQPAAQVAYDNLGVWQYESPQLAIHNAVVLSWPVTSGQFILESAASVEGPWEPVPDPWWRTNAAQNEVCILAPESMKLFRLRFVP
ncbi:MAG: hypothetical protein JXQ71_06705 [Verrucomicrobia bacterium]|nr:hypothetical protein [Verrucomicrobiota bacterium]